MNATQSFFWHDYETFGRYPRLDRPAQFAGLRTDADLNEIDAPVMVYCQPAADQLPDPESCLLTGITPQHCASLGVKEHAFAETVHAQLSANGTVGVGYNSIKFDDEVTRFLLWRNLIDPYAREWQNQCGRWDLLNVVRCAFAFRPDTLIWPLNAEGLPSMKLEHLAQANGLAHTQAHDALSDVRVTLALARLIRQKSPRLWEFCLSLRDKHKVAAEIGMGRPFWHVSGMYGVERGCVAMVWPLAPHPFHKNEVVVWDLSQDPARLEPLSAQEIKDQMFLPKEQLAGGTQRLPIKTIHINQSPIVVSQLKTLSSDLAQRWGVDVAQCLKHAEILAKTPTDPLRWQAVFERQVTEERDVDEDLYGALVSSEDRRVLERLRPKASRQPVHAAFADDRLGELLFRYRARNFTETLSEEEASRWRAHCLSKLGPLDVYLQRLQTLASQAPTHSAKDAILTALTDHARQVFAEPGAGISQTTP